MARFGILKFHECTISPGYIPELFFCSFPHIQISVTSFLGSIVVVDYILVHTDFAGVT
jgi:hypothetical protein